jgi:excisionase family DNA binding protein
MPAGCTPQTEVIFDSGARAMCEHVNCLQAGNVETASRVFGIPAHHLRRAIRANELQAHNTGGRFQILIFDDLKQWLRTRPASSPRKRAESCHG